MSCTFKGMEDVTKGKCFVINPFSFLVEVVAAVRRRTSLASLAMEVKRELTDNNRTRILVIGQLLKGEGVPNNILGESHPSFSIILPAFTLHRSLEFLLPITIILV